MTTAFDLLPIVVLISGNGSNLQAIIDQMQAGTLPVEIRAVISNRPHAYGLERARLANIPAEVVDHTTYPDRSSYNDALQAVMDRYRPALVVLAGFTRVLTPPLVAHYHGRMLNVHPSLLPAFRGLNTHQRVLAEGAQEHGVTVHFVTPDLDGGPIIAQRKVPVLAEDDAASLAARVLQEEHRLYPEIIRCFAEGRLKLQGQQVTLNGLPLSSVLWE